MQRVWAVVHSLPEICLFSDTRENLKSLISSLFDMMTPLQLTFFFLLNFWFQFVWWVWTRRLYIHIYIFISLYCRHEVLWSSHRPLLEECGLSSLRESTLLLLEALDQDPESKRGGSAQCQAEGQEEGHDGPCRLCLMLGHLPVRRQQKDKIHQNKGFTTKNTKWAHLCIFKIQM